MKFCTVTKSGVFQFVQKDITNKIVVPEVEYQIVSAFNKRYDKDGMQLCAYSENLPLAFMIVATTNYNSDSGNEEDAQHPDYSKLVLSTSYLSSLADSHDLKCTRKGV